VGDPAIGAAVACIFGILLGAPTLKLRGDYLAIVTLGFGEIVRIFLNNLSEPFNFTNGPKGLSSIDPDPCLWHRFRQRDDDRGPRLLFDHQVLLLPARRAAGR
jgi:branched-chain amino acid transport system permease protein